MGLFQENFSDDTEFYLCFHEYLVPGDFLFLLGGFDENIVFDLSDYFLEFSGTDSFDDIFSDILCVYFLYRNSEIFYIFDIDRLGSIIEKSQSKITQSSDDNTERENSKCG